MATTPSKSSKAAERFHATCNKLLTQAEKEYFLRALGDYSKLHKVDRLIMAAKALLDTKEKQGLVELVCDLIPKVHRNEFRMAFPEAITTADSQKDTGGAGPADISNLSPALRKRAGQVESVILPPRGPLPLGLRIRGGSEYGQGIFISEIDRGGIADKNGLCVGDLLVQVNKTSLNNASHSDAIKALQSANELQIQYRRVGAVPNRDMKNAKTSWESTLAHENKLNSPILSNKSKRKKVVLRREDGDLGVSIRGGAEIGLGIFVSACAPDGLAYAAGLQAGDQIVAVNDVSFIPSISLEKAIQTLKASKHLIIQAVSGVRIPKHLYLVESMDEVEYNSQAKTDSMGSDASAALRRMTANRHTFGNASPSARESSRMIQAAKNASTAILEQALEGAPTIEHEKFMKIMTAYENGDSHVEMLVQAAFKLPVELSNLFAAIRPKIKAVDYALFEEMTSGFKTSLNDSFSLMEESISPRRLSSDGSHRVSVIMDNASVALERPIDDINRKETARGGDFPKDYIGQRKVCSFSLQKEGSLGLTLEGGDDTSDAHDGIRVRTLRKDGYAIKKLKVGDEILYVNGLPFWRVSHDAAINTILTALKDGTPDIKITVARERTTLTSKRNSDIDMLLSMSQKASKKDEYDSGEESV
eukprot:m.125713 g.125713  ORF g.125713 m.125713 type:complete len:647 (-) comp14499_c0_seq22:86-2026(-)